MTKLKDLFHQLARKFSMQTFVSADDMKNFCIGLEEYDAEFTKLKEQVNQLERRINPTYEEKV